MFSLWGCERDQIQLFIKEANPTQQLIHGRNFLDTAISKGERWSYLGHPDTLQINRDLSVHTFHFLSCPRHRKGRHSDSSEHTFRDIIANFKLPFFEGGYPVNLVNICPCRNTIQGERVRPQESKQRAKENIAFPHTIPNLKKILMSKWHHIENDPLPREIYKEKPLTKKGKSLKVVVRVLWFWRSLVCKL